MNRLPHHAIHRARRERFGCQSWILRVGSRSLGRSAKDMRSILIVVFILICAATHLYAQPPKVVLWRSERVHYDFPGAKPHWAWIILPVDHGATNGGSFKATIDGIFRSEPSPLIKHVCLQSVHRSAAMQKEVMDRLPDTAALKKYSTRSGSDGRTYINPPMKHRMIEAALLQTSLVREMNQALAPRGLHIGRVSMEKLSIFAEKGAYHWDAFAGLLIDRAEPGGQANGRPPIRSETNQTSPAAGSRR